MIRRPLLPPATPPSLPHGLQRGGIFEAGYVPPTYIDQAVATVPTDSPATYDVAQDIFMSPVGFTRSETVRTITGPMRRPGMAGFGQPPGYTRYWTSYDRGHRHSVDVAGFGQMVQGMGLQRGAFIERAGAPPLPIGHRAVVRTPHGTTEGGIFGPQHVVNGMATGQRVPRVPTTSYTFAPRMPGLRGFGAGPDGLGG